MKKKTIWTITIIMGISFAALLYVQLRYIDDMVKMKKDQFDESVGKALYQTARNMELNETLRFLESDINKNGGNVSFEDTIVTSNNFEQKMQQNNPANTPKALLLRHDKNSISDATKQMQEQVKNRYVYQKALLDEVVYKILKTSYNKPLRERMNFKQFDQSLRTELQNNGVFIDYHFVILSQDGKELYRCPDFSDEGNEYVYSQELFRGDSNRSVGVVRVHFPEMGKNIFSSIRFLVPSVIFTIVLLVTFFFVVIIVFQQKKSSEMKNDFINNMTHELKTPISSISLASQMLNDDKVNKTPSMLNHLGKVIDDETKRLRYLVEKVLQMSLFEQQKAILKKKMLDLNELVENIANTFLLRVEHTGGFINPDLEALDADIYVDETHFSNAIFNIFDNAIKYKHPDRPVEIDVKSWNDDKMVYLSISDNGVGMSKENLKRIFEKFYRVHTGNRHDVKGFGLGLAYVKSIVDLHKGTITVDSSKDGSTFTIAIPLMKSGK